MGAQKSESSPSGWLGRSTRRTSDASKIAGHTLRAIGLVAAGPLFEHLLVAQQARP
ncbi:hypothetical protein ACFXO9_34460 [Nocardia tengchongensis]|uniref:hypothetical protein n=1 Tax=Nocardia tengchongensis TaxID=2055889 RepID=UPI0036CB1BC4